MYKSPKNTDNFQVKNPDTFKVPGGYLGFGVLMIMDINNRREGYFLLILSFYT